MDQKKFLLPTLVVPILFQVQSLLIDFKIREHYVTQPVTHYGFHVIISTAKSTKIVEKGTYKLYNELNIQLDKCQLMLPYYATPYKYPVIYEMLLQRMDEDGGREYYDQMFSSLPKQNSNLRVFNSRVLGWYKTRASDQFQLITLLIILRYCFIS
jgi:hypothetical protein